MPQWSAEIFVKQIDIAERKEGGAFYETLFEQQMSFMSRRAQDLAQTALYIAANSASLNFDLTKLGQAVFENCKSNFTQCFHVQTLCIIHCNVFLFVKNEQVVKRFSFEQPILASS